MKRKFSTSKYLVIFITISLILLQGCQSLTEKEAIADSSNEVIYHVVQRSFFDSNGDLQGDLNGLRAKLGYLQNLGVTSILMLPLYESVYYHNYFADNFEKIDAEFGTLEDYQNLVKEVHRRGMKIYMDMETQYVTGKHLWYTDSYKNPSSPYSHYLIYNGPGNTEPESIIWDIKELPGYDGSKRIVTTVNLLNKDVLDYNFRLFHSWVDPNGDGNFEDGVDGFRIDHMMDDLDWKGKFKDLFSKFWKPLLTRLKQENPNLTIIAEQAEWGSYGIEYLKKAGVDKVFAFRLQRAIASFDKQKIANLADSTFMLTPEASQQIVFIENHDMQRFASTTGPDFGKLKIGAALNLLLGGTPSVYYGQELGMAGSGGFGKFGNTDANDIPQREAFEWYRKVDTTGMALWYKNSGPWWDQTNLKSNDGISLEEEKDDPASLYNFYRHLLRLRKENEVLVSGKYHTLENDNNEVYSFLRQGENEKNVLVVINLSANDQLAFIQLPSGNGRSLKNILPLLGDRKPVMIEGHAQVTLPPYGILVCKLE